MVMNRNLDTVQKFVAEIAGNHGYHITSYEDSDPTTIMLIQPTDQVENAGPDERDVLHLINVLADAQKNYQLPTPLYFQIHRTPAPPPEFGEDRIYSSLIYMIRVSTLE